MKTASLVLIFVIAGCSSNDAPTVAADAAPDAMVADSQGAATGDASADTGGKDAGSKDAGDASVMSADCKTYCDCFEANCASIQTIPGGLSCGDFCAGFTQEQWTCRNAHCQLVVPEHNPGHCMHAVGIDQCM
jgi:hypothetical protein